MAAETEPLAVLLVEDDEDDYLITRDMLLAAGGGRFKLDWCPSFNKGLEAIAELRHGVYLIDYRLGEHTGLELIQEGFATRPLAPVLILTGESDHEIDLEASALGVTDYLVKQELTPQSLERSLRYAISHYNDLHALARSEERYALAVRAANDGIWDWDLVSDKIYFSPRWHAMLGRLDSFDDSDPSSWLELVHEDDVVRLRAAIDAHLGGRTSHLESEHRMRHLDGSWRWVLTRGLAIRGPDGTATRMAGSMSDVTDRRRAERQLQHDALHDSLTGLPNRALFLDRVDQVLRRAERDSAACAVLFLDVDRFKLVNDSLSHAVGDHLLVALADRLEAVLRPSDTVARLGGDEFTILLDGVASGDEALAVAERVQASLATPFAVDGHELVLAVSVGVALSKPDMTAADLVRNADIAMYDARRRDRSRSALFDESMHRLMVDRLSRERDLRRAVDAGLVEVHYQPIVELGTGRIRGLEALARWPDGWPEVEALEFIGIAEETGMISELGLQVLRTSLLSLSAWRRSGLLSADAQMSVNVSVRQLSDPAFPRHVRIAVAAAGLPPSAVRLEITESTLMQDSERIHGILSEVCASGAGLHLDDFGTGYSSLARLHQFPVAALKIDRSFVSPIGKGGSDGGSEVIVRSTVALAHSLRLKVIAEGIETSAQAHRLRALGCEYGQGFLFSEPLDAQATASLLAGWSPARIKQAATA